MIINRNDLFRNQLFEEGKLQNNLSLIALSLTTIKMGNTTMIAISEKRMGDAGRSVKGKCRRLKTLYDAGKYLYPGLFTDSDKFFPTANERELL